MKKVFEKPEIHLIECMSEDIITVSGNIPDIDGGSAKFLDSWLEDN